MGKFGIGARVRHDGDVCEVIGKPEKGKRELRVLGGKYDGMVFWAPKSELEVAGLRLEIGKTYVDRDGVQQGPLVENASGVWVGTHPFAFDGRSWRSDGGFLPSGEDPWDLVAEVVLPAEPAKPQFEVGQRVTVTTRGWGETTDAPYHATIFAVGDDIDLVFDGWDGGHDGDARDGSSNHYYYAASDITPFTLEAGKFYRTRDGRKVGPMEERHRPDSDYPWQHSDGHRIFKSDGTNYSGPNSPEDIVAEWVEPAIVVEDATDPIWEPAVGDKIRWLGKFDADMLTVGSVYEIKRLNDGWVGITDDRQTRGDHSWDVDDLVDKFERVATAQPKFEVGDRVWPKSADEKDVRGHWANFFLANHGADDVMYVTEVKENGFGGGDDEIGISNKNSGHTVVYWRSSRFNLVPADLYIGNAVTATGYISGANGNNFSVVFGDRSYDLPATALKKAA